MFLKIDFEKPIFVENKGVCWKIGCAISRPDMIFSKKIDLCAPIKYKIGLSKVEVLKSYRTFVIQNNYGILWRLRILGNKEILGKSQLWVDT